MTSISLTKRSNINFLNWCLMAIVEESLIYIPNRCVCIGGLKFHSWFATAVSVSNFAQSP
jgi:hypothetical protein